MAVVLIEIDPHHRVDEHGVSVLHRTQDEHDQRTPRREPDHGGNPSDQFTRVTYQHRGFRR
ncbi:hypothetical protein FG87_31755 [Nocardia vulneris]|uniref:Transposase n=1 Tax=Nocardia vulneris TaxID=1141657 RepID=A0ABR4Z7L2_9NOCA|nr:hypothetical protein FG87_31755 [Nocardia vulneris]